MENVLVINPGATSTKIAVFTGTQKIFQKLIEHNLDDLSQYEHVIDQFDYRYSLIISSLKENNSNLSLLDAVVGRGGMLQPVESGTYEVNKSMIDDLGAALRGEHASNLGAILAKKIAEDNGIPAFIVDPVSVDEMDDIARISGLLELPRVSLSHALNSKAIARKAANLTGKSYESLNIIVAHLGTGISISAHKNGRMIDVNNAQEEGPFSSDRCGTVPSYRLVKMCFSGRHSEQEILGTLMGSGGLNSLIGQKDVRKIEEMANAGNKDADVALRALAYQVAKEIGALSTVFCGKLDCIAITGGLAYSDRIVKDIVSRVEFLSSIYIFPGEDEMASLALGVLRVLRGEEKSKVYKGA
ncbi:MAG: butyrate kinase [Spirochaetia bacterium]|jgi:butyrate kinase|nr:butyrate kinase [Spirochaetia bacterium]